MLFQVMPFANEDEPMASLFKSAATYANTILAASTPNPAQAPLTSFRTRALTNNTMFNSLSDQIQSQTSDSNPLTSNARGTD